MDGEDTRLKGLIPIMGLNTGSLMVLAGAVYVLKTLAISYGVGLGGAYQSITSNTTIAPAISQFAANLPALHASILEAYGLFLVGLILVGAAFILFIRRYDKSMGSRSRYTLLHSAFMLMYIFFLYLILSSFYSYFEVLYMYVLYFGIILSLACDAYFEYEIRQPAAAKGARTRRTISIDPSKPFSNVVEMQDNFFPQMSGHLRIVDKHFNSVALGNLHRIADKSLTNFTKITILTSKEMMDSSFGNDMTDFKNELNEMGVGIEVRLMDDKDTIEQHERFIMDDKIAYKIPPFNIINKRSEHITRINHEEANRRFSQLYGRAIKMENYAVKRARDNNPQEPKQ